MIYIPKNDIPYVSKLKYTFLQIVMIYGIPPNTPRQNPPKSATIPCISKGNLSTLHIAICSVS